MENRYRILWILTLAALLLGMGASCEKKEEEEEEKLYMDGFVDYYIPTFVGVGETITLTASGITEPSEVEYKWFFGASYNDTLSAQTVTITFPDSLGTFAITGIATAPGYYNSSATQNVTTVDIRREKSLKGLKYSNKVFTDPRDGIEYEYVTIGKLDWFVRNLAYYKKGSAFRHSPVTHTLFGRFYSWEEATGGKSASGLGGGPQGVCPKGWSVPTNEDWVDLATAVAGKQMPFVDNWDGLGDKLSADARFNGERIWPYSPDNLHSNTVGWNALATGNTQYDHSLFKGFNEYAFWWSSTQKNETQAYYRYMHSESAVCPMNFTSKAHFGASVRCVRLAK
jgi:uncharacterized protein (TIGR02145 family)